MPQPAHAQRAAQEGSCFTPEHQVPIGRPKTPDTANLLQRALASSGSALFSSLGQVSSDSQLPQHLPPVSAEASGLTAQATAVTAAIPSSVPQPMPRPTPVPGTAQQGTVSIAAIPSLVYGIVPVPASLPAAASADNRAAADTATASAAVRDSHTASSRVSESLDTRAEALYHPVQQPAASKAVVGHSTGSMQQETRVVQQQHMGALSSGTAARQHNAAKLVGVPAVHTQSGREEELIAGQKAASQQPSSSGLDPAEGQHARAGHDAIRAGAGANLTKSAGHVTAEVQVHLARPLLCQA